MATCGSRMALKVLLLFCMLLQVAAVDRGNFKTCEQSSFCKRHRAVPPGQSPYELQLNSIQVHSSHLEGQLINKHNGVSFKLELFALVDNTVRLRITESEHMYPRFEAKDALVDEPKLQSMKIVKKDNTGIILSCDQNNKVVIQAKPLRIDFYSGDSLVMTANSRGLMKFEHYRPKPEHKGHVEGVVGGDEPAEAGELDGDEPGMWEENFKGHADSKLKGPSSIGMDFSFVGFQHIYGIPEHADHFALRNTKGIDPYRLYNLDVFEHEVDNNMALYGSVPYALAHSEQNTVGLFWLNAAETWVDIESASDQGETHIPQMDTHWISESGIIDVFFLLGPKPADVFMQYARLTGTTELPPLFSIAYHQCRWNYNDQEDVNTVDAGFDEHDIPYDVLWLDIEHTDGKRYFTWDKSKFPNPQEMIMNLTAKGRKLVTIIDPHIKRAHGYFVHEEATSKGFYVKNKDGGDYEGWCWPGSSSWLDFLNPEVREYWMSKLALDQYDGSTQSLFVWNDMNEPSVFNGPEVTMHKDAIHHGNWEHRDVHNLYGMMVQKSTHDGLIKRSGGKERPFVLTRAAFAGSQRYGAMWTGDNMAEWSHLVFSLPMLLSLSVTGITFCGADVGGFFKNTEAELFIRWYQAGALTPFFRAHTHIDTRRHEPWSFDENTKLLVRDAIRRRYILLPHWYTVFYENFKTGMPIMRPLWVEFPTDVKTFAMEDQYMIGNSLLVHPVTEAGASQVSVYFPGSDEVWYDAEMFNRFDGPGVVKIPVSLSKVPYYQRGGTIIPKKLRVRRASTLGGNDPYTLQIALDKTGSYANGTLYVDDGHSFAYKNGEFLFLTFTYHKGVLKAKNLNLQQNLKTLSWLERITVLGLQKQPSSIQIESTSVGKRKLESKYTESKQVLVIRKPSVNMAESWTLTIF